MADQWLSIVEYARAHNISDMTVRRRIKNGKLQAVLREGKYYIPTGDPGVQHRTNQSRPAIHTPRNREHFAQSVTNNQSNTDIRDGMMPHVSQPSLQSRPQPTGNQVVERKTLGATEYPHVPKDVKKSVYHQGKVSLEATKLLEFCDRMLESTQQTERRVRSQYQSQIDALTATNKAKDLEILQLSQQVEDLQLLVDIIDREK